MTTANHTIRFDTIDGEAVFELVTTSPAELVRTWFEDELPHGTEGVDMVRAKIAGRWFYFVSAWLDGETRQHRNWNGPFTKSEADGAFTNLKDLIEKPCDCRGCNS